MMKSVQSELNLNKSSNISHGRFAYLEKGGKWSEKKRAHNSTAVDYVANDSV
jgi:hypothetical protein